MRKLCRSLMIISLAVIIGFSLASCGGGGSLNGTWVDRDETLVLNNGSFTLSTDEGEMKGKYSTSGKDTFTLTVEEVRGDFLLDLDLSPSKWFSKASLKKAIIDMLVEYGFSKDEAEDFYKDEAAFSEMESVFSAQTGTYTKDTIKITAFGGKGEFKKQ